MWVLVHTRLCLCPPRLESVPPVLWKSYNQILALKVRFPGDFQSLCPAPRLRSLIMGFQTFTTMGELLWYYCFQFVGHLPRDYGIWFYCDCVSPAETTYHRLGLEPMWLRLEPSQNPAWNLSPHGWDWNPAKTHGTWFHDLVKLRFLMSHCRKNSVRDKVIGKKWIYSDSERSTLQRQSMGHHRGWVQPSKMCFYMPGNLIC